MVDKIDDITFIFCWLLVIGYLIGTINFFPGVSTFVISGFHLALMIGWTILEKF